MSVRNRLFYFQAFLSLVVITVGIILLFIDSETITFTSGINMITTIIAYWLPNPRRPKDDYELQEEQRGKLDKILRQTDIEKHPIKD